MIRNIIGPKQNSIFIFCGIQLHHLSFLQHSEATWKSDCSLWAQLAFQGAQISTISILFFSTISILFFLACFFFYLHLFLPAVLRENPQRTLGLAPHTAAARKSLALHISQWQVAVAHCFTTRAMKSPVDLRFPDSSRSELIYLL